MGDRAEPQAVINRLIDALGVEPTLDEPDVGALAEAIELRDAEGVLLLQLIEQTRVAEACALAPTGESATDRTRDAGRACEPQGLVGIGPRQCGNAARAFAHGGRFLDREDDVGEPTTKCHGRAACCGDEILPDRGRRERTPLVIGDASQQDEPLAWARNRHVGEMPRDLALLGQLDEWIAHRGRTERLLLEANHDREVDVDRARRAGVKDPDGVFAGPAAAEREVRELFAYLIACRRRLDGGQTPELTEDHGGHRHVVAQGIRVVSGTQAMRALEHAPHRGHHLIHRGRGATRTRGRCQGAHDRLAQTLHALVERLLRAPHWPLDALHEMRRCTAPR